MNLYDKFIYCLTFIRSIDRFTSHILYSQKLSKSGHVKDSGVAKGGATAPPIATKTILSKRLNP
jgi:hypothetical protein